MKRLLLITLAALSGSSLTFLVWQPIAGSPEQVPTSHPSISPSSSAIEGIGYVEPASELRKLMFRADGVIRSSIVKAGDVVRKGDLLCELDNSTPRADLELARKQLAQVKADAADVIAGINPYRLKVLKHTIDRLREKVRHAKTDVARYEQLVDKGGVSKQEYDSACTSRTQAEIELRETEAELYHLRNYVTPEKKALMAANIDHATANLHLAEERLRETQIKAPFDGTVLKLLKREGEAVSTFVPETVLLFGDLSRLRVRAEIDERFVKDLKIGQTAESYGRNLLGKSYSGRLVEVEKVMGDKTLFTRAASERKDLQVLQVVIEMASEFSAPVGLQVDVRIYQQRKGPR
jgi:ABC exporter DevB family membrane fusion protein